MPEAKAEKQVEKESAEDSEKETEKEEKSSSLDSYIYKMIYSKMPEKEGQISKPEWLFFDSGSEESRTFINMLENLK